MDHSYRTFDLRTREISRPNGPQYRTFGLRTWEISRPCEPQYRTFGFRTMAHLYIVYETKVTYKPRMSRGPTMAKLCRFVKLNDRFNAQVFTFLLPGRILREFTPDIYSKDFVYGYQRWNVSFVRTDRHIGAFLRLQTPSQGLRCRMDFSFTVINSAGVPDMMFAETPSHWYKCGHKPGAGLKRIEPTTFNRTLCRSSVIYSQLIGDHFTKNVSFIEKSCEFSPEANVFGRKTFTEIDDLIKRNFLQESGDLLVEVEMRNIHSIYECFLRLPKEGSTNSSSSKNEYGDRMESTYFMFGLSDWSISLFPDNSVAEADGSVEVQLQRHTSFDHLCYVRYRIILGDEGTFDSGDLEQVLDASGLGEPFTIGASVHRLSRGRSTLRVKVEMISVVSVSEVYLNVLNRGAKQHGAHCYDRDKQAWMMEADTTGKYLTMRLFYTDISHVPRKFSRYVGWNIRMVSKVTNARPRRTLDGPYSKYYVQQEVDDGCVIKTDISLDENRPKYYVGSDRGSFKGDHISQQNVSKPGLSCHKKYFNFLSCGPDTFTLTTVEVSSIPDHQTTSSDRQNNSALSDY
ncbi:hypothetical protein Btru_019729 [Bulinus truncatus]|nr:hypothetical protein Btru_019729 [Bulinus truncatus]